MAATCAALAVLLTAYAHAAPYDGHKVVRVGVQSSEQLDLLLTMTDDVWSDTVGIGLVDVRVTPGQFAQLQASDLGFEVLIEDVGPLAAATMAAPEDEDFFTAYHPLADIIARVEQYAVDHPTLATVVDFGTSLEGRLMRGVRITGVGDGNDKPGFLMNGGQHAREWINIPMVLYIAEWLLDNYGTDATATRLVDEVDWYILPCMNPDGYEWSWNVGERLWRKNRRDNGDGTIGVDLNRNWGYGWGGPGSSDSTSASTYRGPAPFSEPETQVMRDFVLAHPNIAAYIDYHSYSQLILWPWGYTPELPPDQGEFDTVGSDMAQLILGVHGQTYDYGPAYTTIYAASGVSDDWVYGANWDERIILALTIELRDTGAYGFVLPPEQIVPTCEENLPAALYLADWISESGPALRVQIASEVPALVAPGEGLTVTARVTERSGTFGNQNVSLFYRVLAGDFVALPMVSVGGDLYEATVPPISCGVAVEFHVTATSDESVPASVPQDAPAELLSYIVGYEDPVLEDNFESASGWSVGGPYDDATTGIWTRVDPVGTAAQPEDDHTADPGVTCFVTGQGSVGGLLGENDVDGGKTTLFSPSLDLSAGDARIGYWRWYSNTAGAYPGTDSFHIDITNNGGQSWFNVETIGPSGPGTSGGWVYHEFAVSDFVAPTANVQVRFVASDEGGASIVEAAIDDFRAFQIDCTFPPVPAVSRWGIATAAVGLMAASILVIRRRQTVNCLK